jgi:hypothetical protein
MTATQPQPRTMPEFHMEIRGSRRHTSTHRRRLLSHFGLLVDCKHKRLIGQHSRFLPVSREARTTSTVSLRPTSAVRDPHQPGERNLPSTQDPPSTGLPNYQDRQSALPFPGHAELLLAICATTRRHTRQQFTTFSPIPESTELTPSPERRTPQGLRRVQGEFVTRHSTGTPRLIHDSCTRHRRLHVRHGCHAAATRPERLQPLASFSKRLKPLNPRVKLTAASPPLTPRSMQHRTRHHRPSHELHAPDATYTSLLASTAEQLSPRGVMWNRPN